ncbi:MAG: tetratricopeptide repeat protein [Bacteroidales bacterium]|nr:tetratricopeptide repeat protein [Bacteroidales bacterium]
MRKHHLLLFIFILLLFKNQYAQNINRSRVDSVLQFDDETSRVEALLSLSSDWLFTNKTEALETCNLAISIADNQQLNLLAKAYSTRGNIYFYYDDYVAAMADYTVSLDLYEKQKEASNVANLYSHIGNVKAVQGNYPDALQYYQKSLAFFNAQNDSNRLAGVYNNIGGVKQEMKDYQSALINFKLSEQFDIGNNKFLKGLRSSNMADCYYKIGNIDKAMQLYELSIEIKQSIQDYGGVAQSQSSLAEIYLHQKKYKEAKRYADKAINVAKEYKAITQQASALKVLKLIAAVEGDFETAYLYSNAYIVMKDSIMSPKIADRIRETESNYLFEKENRIQSLEQEKKNLFYYIIITLLTLGATFVLILFLLQRQRVQRLKHKQILLNIEKENLIKAIEEKDKVLVSNTLHLAEKNEMINDLSQKLEIHFANISEKNKPEIRQILSGLNQHKNNQLWEEFELRFLEVHQSFYENLQENYPDLTPNERRLCAFLKLNMNTKEISSITLQSSESIEKARTRLRKKFNLTNTQTSLVAFLNQF